MLFKKKEINQDIQKFKYALRAFEKAVGVSYLGYEIGGSLGLYLQGFPLDKPIHDIDLIMPDTPSINKRLDKLMSMFGDKVAFTYFEHESNYYAFKIHDIEFNIWVVPDYNPTIMTDLGAVQSAYLIMKYKKTYDRDKDQDYFDRLYKSM